MKRTFLFCAVFLLFHTAWSGNCRVDSDSVRLKKRISYFFTFGMGTMIGCNQCRMTGKTASFSSAFIQGVRLGKGISLGAGVGFDAYNDWKTLPLFGSVTWDLFGNRNKVFVQLNYGYSYASMNNQAKEYGFKSERGGKMVSPSLGYRIAYGDVRVAFSLGYKIQRVFSNYESPYWTSCPTCIVPMPLNVPVSSKEVRTDMNRIVLDMTIGWK